MTYAVCAKDVRSNSVKYRECSVRLQKRCSGGKISLSMVGDMFVCKLCQTARDGDGSDVQESMVLGNGVYLDKMEVKTLQLCEECHMLRKHSEN